MARWKLGASTIIEILPLSTCTLCQQKSYISKGIQAIFEILASSRRCGRRPFGWKVSGAHVFYFANGKVKICASNTFEILLLSTCTLRQQKSYISKGFQPIFEIFPEVRRCWGWAFVASARRCWGWAFGRKVLGAQLFYFCNGKLKTLRIDNIWNFATINLYTVPAKILYLQRYSTDFRNLCPSSKMLTVAIWVWKFQVRRCFTFAMAKWKLCASTAYLKFCHFQPVHCASRNPISPKIFNQFSKSSRQLEDVEVGLLGAKFQVRRYFTFAMARWERWRIDNIWYFAAFNLYTVPAKILYLQRYSIDFRSLCLSSKMLTMAIWLESFRCACILLLQWQGENLAHRQYLKFSHFQPVHCASKNPISRKVFRRFSKSSPHLEDVDGGHLVEKFQVRTHFTSAMAGWKRLCIDNIWNFATFNLYTVQAEILYLQRYTTNFRNLRVSSKMLKVGIWLESFRCAGILLLQWQGENLAHRQHLKFCHVQPVHCASKNPISPKVFNRFSEIFASARRCWRWPFGWKVSGSHVFCFCNGKVKTWRIDNIWNFPTFNLYTVPAKILYLERYSGDFRNLRLISKMWTVAIWLKSFRCARILLLQWQGERLCIDNIWNFATFNLYPVQAEILYLQRYSTNFRNLRVSSKMLRVGIGVVSFRCTGILLLQWQGENLAHRQHLKFYHVQPVHCASKNPISPKVFNRFSKSLPQLEDDDDGHLGGKFQVRRYFTFAMAKWKLGAATIFEILPLSSCTLCQQKSYISKGIQPIYEIFASARRCWRCPFGWKVSCAHVFCFCNGKVKTWRVDNNWNFATFNLYTVPAKILYLQTYSTDLRNLCLSSKMLTMPIWVKSFMCARILLLQWQGENLVRRQ